MSFKRIMETADWSELCQSDMDALNHDLDHFFEEVYKTHPTLVDKTLFKVEMDVTPHFTKETAEYVVSMFENKDGSKGQHWDYETTREVKKNHGYEYPCADWYFALNYVYKKLFNANKTDADYFDHACDFLEMVHNPKKYYTAMYMC